MIVELSKCDDDDDGTTVTSRLEWGRSSVTAVGTVDLVATVDAKARRECLFAFELADEPVGRWEECETELEQTVL